MKTILTSAAALAVAATAAFADGHGETVRMGTEGAYAPYNFLDDDGEVAGLEIELGNELCARAGFTCEWVTNDWDGIIPNLVSGNYDTIMAGMSITEERAEVIAFTQNYVPPTASLYVAASDGVDLEGGVIAAQTSTIQAAHVASGGAALLEFATPEETVAAVRAGEADAVFADGDYLRPIVEASGGELMIVGEPVPLGGGIGIGMRQSDTEMMEAFDAAITSMKEDGSLDALLVEWLGEDTQTYADM